MLSLWSRFGQQVVGTCNGCCKHCASCKIGRINCFAARLHAKQLHSGTYLYSAILAGACVVDGSAKAIRNKQWDESLGTVKDELTILRAAAEERARPLLDWEPSTSGAVDESVQQESRHELGSQQAESEREDFLRLSMETVLRYPTEPGAQRPPLPATTLSVTSKWGLNDLPPQSLWSGTVRRQKSFARNTSLKKAAITEVAAMRLILRLMHLVQLSGRSKADLDDVLGYKSLPALHTYAEIPARKQMMLVENLASYTIKVLHPLPAWEGDDRFGFPLASPNYRKHATVRSDQSTTVSTQVFALRQLKDLNYGLYRHFRAYTSQEVSFEQLVARVCDILFHSSVPPNIDTLNILLLGFQEIDIGEDVRAEVVAFLRSFQGWTATRVNELYCAAILQHYRRKDDLEQFSEFISLMRGRKQGLMLAKPGVSIDAACNGRLVRRANGKVNQAVHPMPIMYWEMIKGMLHFAGFDEAVKICRSLESESWGLDWQCIDSLMTDCVRRASWQDGKMLWEKVLILDQKTKKIPKWIFTAVLALCRVCGQELEYDAILQEASVRGYQAEDLKLSVLAFLRKTPPHAASTLKKPRKAQIFQSGNRPLQMSSIVTEENLIVVGKRKP